MEKKIRSAEILCVGTELLLGDIINTNASFLSQRLAELGIHGAIIGKAYYTGAIDLGEAVKVGGEA
jgi:nicotinamide-nucleotide amidase